MSTSAGSIQQVDRAARLLVLASRVLIALLAALVLV